MIVVQYSPLGAYYFLTFGKHAQSRSCRNDPLWQDRQAWSPQIYAGKMGEGEGEHVCERLREVMIEKYCSTISCCILSGVLTPPGPHHASSRGTVIDAHSSARTRLGSTAALPAQASSGCGVCAFKLSFLTSFSAIHRLPLVCHCPGCALDRPCFPDLAYPFCW